MEYLFILGSLFPL